MRRVNEAVIHERHPIPTIDNILEDMTGAEVFTKLELKLGYHQIELEFQSRSLTMVVTHKGLHRYKRVMFGFSSAPEIYQHIIRQVLQGIQGVYGKTREEHDDRAHQELHRRQARGLTLNCEECDSGMDKMEFMSHVLTKNGIGAARTKVDADHSNTCRPQTAAEVRSFLGLVNYCRRFIPDLASFGTFATT